MPSRNEPSHEVRLRRIGAPSPPVRLGLRTMRVSAATAAARTSSRETTNAATSERSRAIAARIPAERPAQVEAAERERGGSRGGPVGRRHRVAPARRVVQGMSRAVTARIVPRIVKPGVRIAIPATPDAP